MKQRLKSLVLLALLPASSAVADVSCMNGIHSLYVSDKDPSAVEVSLGIGRGALNFKGTLQEANGLQILGDLTYSLESQYGDPATLKVSTAYPILKVFGCGRRICFPEDGEKAPPVNPTVPKVTAVLEVGSGEGKSVYDFKQCSKSEN